MNLFSSVWCGIILLTLLFFYCSIGSALPWFRQLPGLEMTEFEWFHWWPFDVLVALFTINLTVVTLRRIPFRFINLGVWTIHTGIIVLVIGSYIYFTKKVEGDAPVFRRQVAIELPAEGKKTHLVTLPESETLVHTDNGHWRFRIERTHPERELPESAAVDSSQPKTAYAVDVRVDPPSGASFIRTLYSGYPDISTDNLVGLDGHARREVTIRAPGADEPVMIPVARGRQKSVETPGGEWTFAIQSTNPNWPILSEPDKGKIAYAVNVSVTAPDGESFIRQLLDGYPQYTEDVMPGQGRAINAIGRKLVAEDLDMSLAQVSADTAAPKGDVELALEYAPTTHFHRMQSWALFVRRPGEKEWKQRVIEGLPRYHDYIAARDQVFLDPDHHLPLRPIDVPVPPGPEEDPLQDAGVRVTGYLRYAHLARDWVDAGSELNPVLRFTAISGDGRSRSFELMALDTRRRVAESGNAEFRWLGDKSELGHLPTNVLGKIGITVPGSDVSLEVPLTMETVVGREGEFTDIEGTPFSYRINSVPGALAMPTMGRVISVAIVDIKTPEGVVTRMVADDPSRTRDMTGEGDPHMGAHGGTPNAPDPRIQMTFNPPGPPIIFAAYPGGMHLIHNNDQGRVFAREVSVGDRVDIARGISVRVDSLITHAKPDVRPRVVPREQRDDRAGESFAMIRLEVNTGGRVQTEWVPYSRYALPDERYEYQGRFEFEPKRLRLADGGEVELTFSRQRHPLPNPIALDSFELATHVGGYTGSASTIMNYHSKLRFLDDGEWSEPREIAVNQPTDYGGFWYFQSEWDKPSAGPGSGMNYTGLGIGNRHGVYTQLVGCCIAAAGMIFAFYIKPVIRRRRFERSRARAIGATEEVSAEPRVAAEEPVGAPR